MGSPGKPEHHHVAAADVGKTETVDELVDEDALLIDQRGHHAGAFDLNRLIQKQDDDDRDHDAERKIAKPGESSARRRTHRNCRCVFARDLRNFVHSSLLRL